MDLYISKLTRYNEALQSFDKALELDPKSIKSWSFRGIVLEKLFRHDEALQSYNKALEWDPKLKEDWYGWGIAQLN